MQIYKQFSAVHLFSQIAEKSLIVLVIEHYRPFTQVREWKQMSEQNKSRQG